MPTPAPAPGPTPTPQEAAYCGDFFAGVQWIVDRLAWEMAAPKTANTGAWVRGVSGAWQAERFPEIAQKSPWILVSPGAASAPQQESPMVALDCQVTVTLIVATKLMSHRPNGAALWVASPAVTKIIQLLRGWAPTPQVNSIPPTGVYPSAPRAFGQLRLLRVSPAALPDQNGQPLPGSAVVELDFSYAWRWCANECECLLPRCLC